MITTSRSMAVLLSLLLLSGCVAYTPYPEYADGGYGYAAPRHHHGEGHHHRHRNHHRD